MKTTNEMKSAIEKMLNLPCSCYWQPGWEDAVDDESNDNGYPEELPFD